MVILNNSSSTWETLGVNTPNMSIVCRTLTDTDFSNRRTLTEVGLRKSLENQYIESNIKSNSGTEIKIKHSIVEGLNPKLYFKFVKSKLTKVQQGKIKEAMTKLSSLIEYAKSTKQHAIYETSITRLYACYREYELSLKGINYYVTKDHIDKFMNKVAGKTIRFKDWSEFPRIAPQNVVTKIKEVQELEIFDNLKVLYNEPLEDKTIVVSSKKKIIEKDPILFGTIKEFPDRYYFIIDWVDEYCDLTFNQMVDKLIKIEPTFVLPKIENITKNKVLKLKQELDRRNELLKNTNRSNFNNLASSLDKKDGFFKKLLKKLIK